MLADEGRPRLRMESALDNCFPSLHVSIAVSSLVLVYRTRPVSPSSPDPSRALGLSGDSRLSRG